MIGGGRFTDDPQMETQVERGLGGQYGFETRPREMSRWHLHMGQGTAPIWRYILGVICM